MAPAGSLTSTFPELLSIFCRSQKMYVRFVCRWGISVFWVSPRLLCERSRKRRIPPCPGPFFNFSYFRFFCKFFQRQKKTAPKWPRPGDEHFRDAVLARRHSRSAIFSGKKGGGKPSMRCFLAKKGDGAELAPSRWMALLRRHFDASARAANLTVS